MASMTGVSELLKTPAVSEEKEELNETEVPEEPEEPEMPDETETPDTDEESGRAATLNSGDYYLKELSVPGSYYLNETEYPVHLEYKDHETKVIAADVEQRGTAGM